MCHQHDVVKQNLHVLNEKNGDFLINNQNIAIGLQIDHPGSRQ